MEKPICICIGKKMDAECRAMEHGPCCICPEGRYNPNCLFHDDRGLPVSPKVPVKEPLENAYATFFAKECAAAGMVHAALASMAPLESLESLSFDELEMVQKARELLLLVHSYVLVRAEYRVTFLSRVKEVMAEPVSIALGPVNGGASSMIQGDKT